MALTGGGFPYGIFAANILGSALMGVLIELGAGRLHFSLELRSFLVVGVLGAFTTFSTYSLDVVLLAERGHWLASGLYMVLSVVLSVGALLGAMALVRALLPL